MGLSREALVAWEIRVHGPLRGAYVWAQGEEKLYSTLLSGLLNCRVEGVEMGDGRWVTRFGARSVSP